MKMKKSTIWFIVLVVLLISACFAMAIALATCVMSRANKEIDLVDQTDLDLNADVGSLVMRKDGAFHVINLRADEPTCTVAFRGLDLSVSSLMTRDGVLCQLQRVMAQQGSFVLAFATFMNQHSTFAPTHTVPLEFAAGTSPFMFATAKLVLVLAGNRCAVVHRSMDDDEAVEMYDMDLQTSDFVQVIVSESALLCCTSFAQTLLPLETQSRKRGFKRGELSFVVHGLTTERVLTQLSAGEYQLAPLHQSWSNPNAIENILGHHIYFIDNERVVYVRDGRLLRSPGDHDLGLADVRKIWTSPLTAGFSRYILVQTGEHDLWVLRADLAQAQSVVHLDAKLLMKQLDRQMLEIQSFTPMQSNKDGTNGDYDDDDVVFAITLTDLVLVAGRIPRFSLDGGEFIGAVTSKKGNKVKVLTKGQIRFGKSPSATQDIWGPMVFLVHDRLSDSILAVKDLGRGEPTRSLIALTDSQGTSVISNRTFR